MRTKVQTTQQRGWSETERRRRRASIMLFDDTLVEDAIALAGIREQVRLFGVDRVRGL